MESWDKIAAKIELCLVIGDDGRPTEADLDAYEVAAGFKLPLDYRRFALAYGRGMMGVGQFEFRFDTPRSKVEGRGKRATRKSPKKPEPDSGLREYEHVDDNKQQRRMVIFSDVCDHGDLFAWAPSEATDPDKHEMAIYLIGDRGDRRLFRLAGSSFLEVLVNEILRGPHDRKMRGKGHGRLKPLAKSSYFQ